MGPTHWTYSVEGRIGPSIPSPATWSPFYKGPYRYLWIQAEPQNKPLKLLEFEIKGYPQPITPS